ncbi:DUF6802 family protein [Actinophytocola gossypii]|uniref:DUF6802 domain-containing protein n=1 Tax=Actinophytocola gossypii TaxID=2812003 RepID=A0ABT2JFB7_9PSEU|nr:DUF6802 family protein [Actinophytocola gossypii]MCT2586456.1 hypothetical protein [Actinophytocola gossypii]
MYVDDGTTTDDDTTATDTDAGQDELTVEIDGEDYMVEENVDLDGDGQNDTALVETETGEYMAFADTDGDGQADVAVQYDEQGNVVAGAEYDESTGEWHEESVDSLPTPTGDGADDATGSSSDTDTDTSATDVSDTSTDTSTDTSAGGDMQVDLPGEDVNAGPATYDTDGDGVSDTAVVTDAEGTTYAFTDVDGDGDADQAVIIEQDGDVTVAEHTGEDEWTVVEEGQISADGSYTPDSTSGADAVWAER